MPREAAPPQATARGRLSQLRASNTFASGLLAERAVLGKELAKLKVRAEELRVAEAQLEARRAKTPLSKSLEVKLSSALEGAVAEVSYFLRGAGWCPSYTLRLSGGRALVDVRASVAQRTGESWDDVELSVTTAEAPSYVDLPELESLRIGRKQSSARRGYRSLVTDPAELLADFRLSHLAAGPPIGASADVGTLFEASEDELTPVKNAAPFADALSAPAAAYGAPQGFAPLGFGGMSPSASLGGPMGRGMGAPPMAGAMGPPRASIPQAAAPTRHKARARETAEAKGGGAARRGHREDALAHVEPISSEPEPRWLAFDTLRLPPPRESRGRLVARES